MPRAAGQVIGGRFELHHPLGEGGMGEVWAATHQVTRKTTALKFLKAPTPTLRARFLREAHAAARVSHPHVAEVSDVFEEADGQLVMVMELLQGESLQARLSRSPRLEVAEAAALLLPVASALGYAHAQGVVHRDLKPDNVFVARGPDGAERVKVLDFGIAKVTLAEELGGVVGGATETGMLLGTPHYMSPEQAMGERVDAKSDVWSLGIILYQVLSGALPTAADSLGAVLKRVLTAQIAPLESHGVPVPPSLAALVRGMLAEHASDRPSMTEVYTALREHAPATVAPPPPPVATAPAADASPGMETGAWLSAHDAAMAPVEAPRTGTLAHAATMSASTHPSAPAPVPAALATPAATARSVAGTVAPEKSGAERSPGWLVVAIGALVVVGGGGIAAWRLLEGGGDRDRAASRGVAEEDEGEDLREPTLGLDAIAKYEEPPSTTTMSFSPTFWDAAAADFEEAARQEGAPDRWRAAHHFARGEAQLGWGQTQEALASMRRAVKIAPTWAVANAGLATATSLAGEHEAGLAVAIQAQRLAPTWWGAIVVTARILNDAGRHDEAIQEYRRALLMVPDHSMVLAELALAYHAAGLDSEAERYAERALGINPDRVDAHVLLAERALERRQGPTALAHATRAVALSPRSVVALLALADARALSGDVEGARATYRKVLEVRAEIGDAGAPASRLDAVRVALDAGRLPSPRHAQPAGPAPRSRRGCAPGDPLCSDL